MCSDRLIGLALISGCGIADVPSVFTDVRPYIDWIRESAAVRYGFSEILLIFYMIFFTLRRVNGF